MMKYVSLFIALVLFQLSASAQGYRTNNIEKETKAPKEAPTYGKNIISFSPVQIVFSDVEQSSPDVAVAFTYERIFNNNLVAFRLPVSLSMKNNFFYVMPTLKLYPRKQGIAKYAVGPQLLFGSGDGTYQDYYQDPVSFMTYTKDITMNRRQVGFLINNSVNFTIAKAFYVGVDASLGIIYYDNLPKNSYNYYSSNLTQFTTQNSRISPAFQLNFSMGYRF
jgi:hypothetical protein